MALPPQHGTFLSNCPAHCQTGIANWDQVIVNGTSIRDAFLEWYAGKARARHYEACDVVPCGRDACGASGRD